MRRSTLDLGVGIFMLIGLLALGWMSVKLGRVDFLGSKGYVVNAEFPTVGGLKVGSTIEIAGVEVGRVDRIQLKDYQAQVVMLIQPQVKLQEDAIASIKTKGLIGERYVRISPGGSDKLIPPNGRIREVEPPVDIEELLSKYIFGKV
jgi:phospholipid/cholesterol/gamma-HCH transport system substrate-binding protein